jgi:AcrR family transcriptional regulator
MDGPREPLDGRLVRVALDLLANEGIERVSLRRIARRAGVSHGAPLRHFPSLASLLAEVAARGFRLLSESIEKAGAQLPPGAGVRARLDAAGRAYVNVAVENSALFALMFRRDSLDPDNAAYRRESAAAFEHLARLVRSSQDAGWHPEGDTRVLAGSVWAAVHGLATLWAQGAFAAAVPDASLADALDTTLDLVADQKGDPS